jgi:3-oxoacyl-[acyl-carrier-protein] synthase III
MRQAYIAGAGNTSFGRHEGSGALDLMAQAAQKALDDAQIGRAEIDGVLCGYATTLPHLMLSTLFCERFSLEPAYAHSMQLGGATGCAMLMLARELVRAGRCTNVLVVAGENRLSGQARDSAIQTLAQVGDADSKCRTALRSPPTTRCLRRATCTRPASPRKILPSSPC